MAHDPARTARLLAAASALSISLGLVVEEADAAPANKRVQAPPAPARTQVLPHVLEKQGRAVTPTPTPTSTFVLPHILEKQGRAVAPAPQPTAKPGGVVRGHVFKRQVTAPE